nr:4Fe-4S ferredoxin [Clostridia bacterium]
CGTCVRLCPRGNIRLEAGRAVIGEDCAQCLGCLQYCPTSAISIGAITDKREHYHNPAVTADDLCQSVIHIE